MRTLLSVIVPIRNDAEHVIPFYYELIKHIPQSFELIWVNDCSEDATGREIETLTKRDERVKCIVLTKQFGKEASVMAGLDYATGEYIVIMGSDMQHPPATINKLLFELENGWDIANAVISNKQRVSLLQKWSMDALYYFINKLRSKNEIANLTEFRGFKKSVIHDILFIKEKHFFPDHYFAWSSYQITDVAYKNRKALRKNIRYTQENLYNTSKQALQKNLPGFVKTLVVFGATLSIASLFFIILFLIEFYKGNAVHTGALGLTSLLFAGGLQIFIYSSYKQKIKSELFRICKSHQYVVKNIIEPDPFLSEYSYLGSSKIK
jgi:glycosyltransferase involved in cell wall biosynthesis